jgi:cellulose synthase/poly-beta-1,6-N-acetylglucosamine synthase-like glycosyltransferase
VRWLSQGRYELIIVNDGSKDKTLDVLIQYYDLIRVDHIFEYKLNTKPVRGIYMNRSIPKLVVVDKENGGKEDSLNAGINISRKEYFCGIDADSLLEDDALLKLASLVLDEGVETPALGGNVFPVNGCAIERGQIVNIQIPKKSLARFQTMEYMRAFMAGRLGWAKINSLLIISGAFGLFRKERVIRAGGYLTSRGKYAKDTVGEDMELIVRINRLMREIGIKYRIRYAYNANCWTEVPEDLQSLKRQRYRWHRGLIEILTFHKRMLFNPRYGRIGLLAMPYFLIFSFWRVGGTINMLKKPTGWGKPERKGFAAANQSAKG